MRVATPAQIRTLKRMARARNLDVSVLMANFAHEGLSGGIGDGGHAFGPGQMNDAGGVLTGKLSGKTPQQKNQWAWSKQGMSYLLDGIARVAAGKRGAAAMKAIVFDYERPADAAGAYSARLAAWKSGDYGQSAGPSLGAGQPKTRSRMKLNQGQFRQAAAQMFLEASAAAVQGDFRPQMDIGQRLEQARQDAMQRVTEHSLGGGKSRGGVTIGGKAGGGINELFYDPIGGIADGQQIGAIGGHGDHDHFAAYNPGQMLAAIRYAQKTGMRVSENPYVDKVDPVHTEGSWHYQTFKGTYNGRKLGKAIDVSGSPAQMAAFYRWARKRFG